MTVLMMWNLWAMVFTLIGGIMIISCLLQVKMYDIFMRKFMKSIKKDMPEIARTMVKTQKVVDEELTKEKEFKEFLDKRNVK